MPHHYLTLRYLFIFFFLPSTLPFFQPSSSLLSHICTITFFLSHHPRLPPSPVDYKETYRTASAHHAAYYRVDGRARCLRRRRQQLVPWIQDWFVISFAIHSIYPSKAHDSDLEYPVVYNKWHQTELERWLSDNSIPYPTPADRKDLENLVEKNWNDYVIAPYTKWDTAELSSYLQHKGKEAQSSAESGKDTLVEQVKTQWYETEDNAQTAWNSVKDWILDTWTDSQLKAFADKHGVPGMFSFAPPSDVG